MVIATFTSTTAWAGRTITFDDGVFALQDHGAITAANVMEYDQRDHLTWTADGLREWVEGLASAPPAAPPVPQPATPQVPAGCRAPEVQPLGMPMPGGPIGSASAASLKRGAPLWVWAVIGGVLLAIGIGVFMLNRVDTSTRVAGGSGGGADSQDYKSGHFNVNTGHLRVIVSWSQLNDSQEPFVMFYVEDVNGDSAGSFICDPKKGNPQSEDLHLPDGTYRAGVLSRDAKWTVEVRQM